MRLRSEGISRNYFRNGRGMNYFAAVDNVDFELEEGRITCIVGRSGSGKTTLINMLGGLLTPTGGNVYIGDADFYELGDDERSVLRCEHIGIVPQGQTGLRSLTVIENVLAPAMMYGHTDGHMYKKSTGARSAVEPDTTNAVDIRDRAQGLLDRMGIAGLADVYSNELSGGELRRMSIARALINDPEILIADEPTADLDDETTAMVLGLFRELADNGTSVLMVTHEHAAMEHADILYRMESGKIINA